MGYFAAVPRQPGIGATETMVLLRRGTRRGIGTASGICLIALAAPLAIPGSAQAQSTRPNVEMDQSVLDSLGPAPDGKKPPPRAPSPKPAPPTAKKSEAALPKPSSVPDAPRFAPVPAPAPAAVASPTPSAVPQASEPPAIPPAQGIVAQPPPPPPPTAPVAASSTGSSQRPTAAVPSLPTPGEMAARIAFAGEETGLSEGAQRTLDALLPRLAENERLRVEILGFAALASEPSQARRLSLARALAVRSYLVGQGIKTNRVDVRALGNRNDGAPTDRVDLVVAER
jgi:outer membrane protein OmpA-like peptidoglycan-associated protein